MNATPAELWQRFQQYYTDCPSIGLAIDASRVAFTEDFFAAQAPALDRAFDEMAAIERGDRVNTSEQRSVGHYWLRKPELLREATDPELRRFADEIPETLDRVRKLAARVHGGELPGAGGPFAHLLVIGIGGSALGPQFVARALGHPATDRLRPWFFDNTDPDGMEKVLAELASSAPDGALKTALGRTLCIVISKSGTTPETANGMREVQHAYRQAGLAFARHAVAITMRDSTLDKTAAAEGWLDVFPMWDWVGGRTSETSVVGLLPAALQGLDIDALLAGARACDELTRVRDARRNPAALLALLWLFLTDGRGSRDMVMLPYKDRLELVARYLQQLVMESLGKKTNRAGEVVNQGITVYGNKGSTDQHAYVQQLRDGVLNFFVVFLEVLQDRTDGQPSLEVKRGITSGDYLSGFLQGTRRALWENGRQSITLTLDAVTPHRVGALIALFERAVGLYAGLVGINAYDQPGVEAGKKAAEEVLALQQRVVDYLAGVRAAKNQDPTTADAIAANLGAGANPETVFKICEHLVANPARGMVRTAAGSPGERSYALQPPAR